jgi:mevalonate kinase
LGCHGVVGLLHILTMPAISASAPGKIILCGEHAVVYGFPAIAIPLHELRTRVVIQPDPFAKPDSIHIVFAAYQIDCLVDELPDTDPIRFVFSQLKSHLGLHNLPAMHIHVSSNIPSASGLGSSAALAVALNRAVSEFIGFSLADDEINQLAFEVEKLNHGTPSGVDNTVSTFAQPIYFIKDQSFSVIRPAFPLNLLVADSGLASSTSKAVNDVRALLSDQPQRVEHVFTEIGNLVKRIRTYLDSADPIQIGREITANHRLLQELQVSCPELDRLVDAAIQAGAYGAKLCGAGQGGNMIALVDEPAIQKVSQILRQAGAVNVIATTLPKG